MRSFIQDVTRLLFRRNGLFLLSVFFLDVGCGGVSKETKDHYASGAAFFQEKKLDTAIGEFQKVYQDDPDYLSTRLMLGKCYFYSEDFKKAKEIFGEDFANNPGRLNSGIWWFRTRFILGEDPSEILLGVNSILEIDPEKTEAWILRGLIEEKLGKPSEAVRSYLKVAEDSDRVAFANYRLSKVFRVIGISARAEKYAEKARALGYEIPAKSDKVK